MKRTKSNKGFLVHVVARGALSLDFIQKSLKKEDFDVQWHGDVDTFLNWKPMYDHRSCLIYRFSKYDPNCLSFYEDLKALSCHTPTLIISDDHEIRSAVECLKAGAIDYLATPYTHEDLLMAVESAFAIDFAKRSRAEAAAKARASFEMLTSRERTVMGLVTTGLLNKQMAWSLGISEGTIKSHRAQVMNKMEAKTLPSLVRLADLIALQPDGRIANEAGQ